MPQSWRNCSAAYVEASKVDGIIRIYEKDDDNEEEKYQVSLVGGASFENDGRDMKENGESSHVARPAAGACLLCTICSLLAWMIACVVVIT